VVNGQPRKGLVQVSKTGWAYILDRATGRPLIGIQERPVLQEPRQATAATQPYPIGDAIVPQSVDIAPEDFRLINEGRIYTPFWTTPIAAKPDSVGGANWPPSSYDPTSHLLYVCATDEVGTFQANELKDGQPPGRFYTAGKIGQAAAMERGIFAALDVRTNRLVWRRQWRDMCYSGSVVTAGGLVFVGRNDGRLVALDKHTGDQLWEFRTDAGINAAASTFEYRGEQYVAVVSGGAVFANDKHGDSVWLFSLKGTLGPVPLATPQSPTRAAMAANQPADLAHGKVVFNQACVTCHGDNGAGGVGGGADLPASRLSAADVTAVIAGGRNKMPGFSGMLSPSELQDVAAYVHEVLAHKAAGS
jgi:quinohemoprotein ethanol dehydrogenase